MKVLLIEDDADIVYLLRRELRADKVLHAATIGAAFQMLAAERPDVIALDLKLPGSSAAETIALIRELKRRIRGLPIIVMTGFDAHRDAALLNGADRFVSKAEPDFLHRIRLLAHSLIGGAPCANRETIEAIEAHVRSGVSAPPFLSSITARVASVLPSVTEMLRS